MAKKKSKHKALSQAVIVAQHQNRYIEKIRHICQACGSPQAFSFIARPALERLFRTRMLPFAIFPAPGEVIPERELKDCRILLFDQVKTQAMPLFEGGPAMPLDDCLGVAYNFHHYLRNLGDGECPHAAEVKKGLALFIESDLVERALVRLSLALWTASLFVSDYRTRVLWLTVEFDCIPGDTNVQRLLYVHSLEPERIRTAFDGSARPAHRVCWAFGTTGLSCVEVKPSDLGSGGSFAALPHPAYIQSHALQRLAERMDGVQPGLLHYFVFMSLYNPRAVATAGAAT
ncbi:MAG: hypothetical protein QME74_02685 [Candidatus Edwardsbacteria bacterium]|nr:hypothetical protein [Candidatus Edwardsbacteria bacterium]